MFKKLINRSESNQVVTDDSALRDIIPSNNDAIPKKPRQKRWSMICKIVLLIFILGLIAIGIVVLALILAYSHNALMNFLMPSSIARLIPLSNKTRLFEIHEQNLTATANEQDWKKLTIAPTSNKQKIHLLSSLFKIKQENEHLPTNTLSMKSYPSSNTVIHEQSTSATIPTTMPNRQSTFMPSTRMKVNEDSPTSLYNQMTMFDTFTSTITIQNIRDRQTETSEKTSLTTLVDLQSSTKKPNKKLSSSKHEEDDVNDDFLFF